MNLIYHPSVRRDVRSILKYYGTQSSRAADRFSAELSKAEGKLETNPTHYHFISGNLRRLNLGRFPFHMIYEVVDGEVYILVVRHHRRHPDYGLRRRWPADS